MWSQFVGLIASIIEAMYGVLGSWGWAIILFTVAVKLLTWPLTAKQIKSSKAMQALQPRQKAIQEKYKGDKEKQTQETMKLYQELGVSPLGGCLPMLVQMPIWFGLYQAIMQLSNRGVFKDPFLLLPTLACPSPANAGCTIEPLTKGMGWVLDVGSLGVTWPYLVLPILTIVSQLAVSRLMTPTPKKDAAAPGAAKKDEDPTAAMMSQMNTIMPLMFGVFALQFPAGLALYWVANNMLTFVQYWALNRPQAATLTLAPAAVGGATVIETPVVREREIQSEKEIIDVKPRRKRKKR